MSLTFVPFNRSGWTAYATSFFDSSFDPHNMIDGDIHTSCVTPTTFSFPWEVWVDMGVSQTFSAISFQRRQDGPQDSPGHVRIYTSNDGIFWAGPVVDTTWTNTSTVIIQPLPSSITAQWVKISMIGIAIGARGALSCAEFNVGQSADTNPGDAMTLQCTCSKNPNVSSCHLVGLTFHAELIFTNMPYGVAAFAELVGGPITVGLPLSQSNTQTDVTLDVSGFKAAWDNLEVHFGGAASLFQPPSKTAYALANASWYIRQDYSCIDTSTNPPTVTPSTLFAVTTTSDSNICVSGGFLKQVTTAGSGGSVVLYTSSPLGSCDYPGGGDVFVGKFTPAPKDDNNLIDDNTTSGQICLCVTGGTPPYIYTILSGRLPCGQFLNPNTGCIGGSPDGSCPGTDDVTFQVIDSQNLVATVDCGFLRPCANGSGGGDFGNAFY